MTLEGDWWRRHGAPRTPAATGPLRAGDVVARGLAILILLLMVGFALAAAHLVLGALTTYVVVGVLVLAVVFVASRVRAVARDVARLRGEVESLRSRDSEKSESGPPEP